MATIFYYIRAFSGKYKKIVKKRKRVARIENAKNHAHVANSLKLTYVNSPPTPATADWAPAEFMRLRSGMKKRRKGKCILDFKPARRAE